MFTLLFSMIVPPKDYFFRVPLFVVLLDVVVQAVLIVILFLLLNII